MEIKDKKALAQSFIIHCKDKERRSSLPSLTVERLHCTRVTIFAGDSNPLTAMFFVSNETKFGKNWTLLSNNVNTTIRKHSLWAFIFRVVMSLGFDVKCRAVIKFLISCNLCTYTRNNLQVSWEYNVHTMVTCNTHNTTELSRDRCYGLRPFMDNPEVYFLWV